MRSTHGIHNTHPMSGLRDHMSIFGTSGIRGDVSGTVTPELALAVGRAVGSTARERQGSTTGSSVEVVIGRDGRTTGPALLSALAAGLASTGVEVRRAGVVPTPTLAFASRDRHGIMVTASHNPPTDNGLKLFLDGTEYDSERERAIADRVAADPASGVKRGVAEADGDSAGASPTDDARIPAPADWTAWTEPTTVDPLPSYRDEVVAYANEHGTSLDDLTVAVDCGNGVAGLATPQVLRELGAEVLALNANVDGHFPGRRSKPTPESISDLRAFVASGPADLGVAHDGDADRIVVVDAGGEIVHEDTVLAILAERYVRASDAEDPVVVTTPNASARIDDRVRAAGGRVERVGLGALNEGIAAAEGRDGDVVFAAEPWKHVHVPFGLWMDAVVSAAVIARLVADDGLASLLEPIRERPYRKRNVPCPDAAKGDVMDRLAETLPAANPDASVDTEYGIRLEFADASWVLVRPSGTEAYIRLYAESDDVEGLVSETRTVVEAAIESVTE